MTAYDDRLGPTRDEAWDIATDDRLAKDNAAQDVADRAVRAAPHFLEAKFLDPRLIRRDRRAFDGDTDFLGLFSGINGDLIVGAVAFLDPQIVVEQVDIQVWQNEFFLDEIPDDPGHFIAIHFNNRVLDFDLRHWGFLTFVGTFWLRVTPGGEHPRASSFGSRPILPQLRV